MSRFANPAQCPPTPFGDGKRVFDLDIGGRTMLRHIPARPEQTSFPHFLSDKVSIAIRSAALAPDLASALDIAGAALVDIAAIARIEVQTSTVVDDAARGTPVSPDTDDRFGFAHAAVDQAITTLDRLGSIFEAIQRCARDVDLTVEDLAIFGRELVQAETERLDVTFSHLAHQQHSAEVRHG
jgi:hypothetical protein